MNDVNENEEKKKRISIASQCPVLMVKSFTGFASADDFIPCLFNSIPILLTFTVVYLRVALHLLHFPLISYTSTSRAHPKQ